MPRDAGSEEMAQLLKQGGERLGDDSRQLAAALKESHDLPYGIPPQSGFDALGDIRQSYRELRAAIDAVETTDATKGDILDALDTLDKGWGAYERALETGISRRAAMRAKSAKRVLKRGSQDLKAATRRLP
jgi:hypothetical protein